MQPVIKQEEIDISGDEFEEPFNELNFGPILLKDEMLRVYGDRHGQEELNELEESVFVSAVEPSAAAMEDSVQSDMEPLRLESDEEGIDSTEMQLTLVGTVTHPQNLECLERKKPHCRLKGAGDADSSNRSISEESIFEKLTNISLSVEVEASLSGKAERLECQGIHPGQSICMTSPFEGHLAIMKEESGGEERNTGAEEGRRPVAEKVVEGEKKSFKCYHCGNKLMTKRGLIKHMEVHGFGNSYNCVGNGRVFPSNSKVIHHVLTNSGSKQPKRVECCESTSRNSIHERQKASRMGARLYKCEKCSKNFSFPSYLITHMRSHTVSKPYKCLECSKCFSNRSNLIRHMRSHTGSKPYKCVECSKCFSQSHSLRTHKKLHTVSKQYKCLECTKCFSYRSKLITHERSHTGSKPYKCVECSKCFSHSSNLRKHMILHAGSKPYKCVECSKCFSDSGNRRKHMILHTGSKPYKCLECSRCFSFRSSLTRHIRTQTGSVTHTTV